jgi:hypothetical protein
MLPQLFATRLNIFTLRGIRAQPEVTQARFPPLTRRAISGRWFFAASGPTTPQPSATVNPYGCPACVRNGAPSRTVNGPSLSRDMLITPRRSKSRLHRQRIRAKFSHGLYRPLPDHCWPDVVSYSRGNHRLPSGTPIPVSTCRTAGLTCFIPAATPCERHATLLVRACAPYCLATTRNLRNYSWLTTSTTPLTG